MPTPKIVKQVSNCGECPNYGYYSGGAHRCSLVDETVLDKTRVAPFCPLPDFPSKVIAAMEHTIVGLRGGFNHVFSLYLLTYIATKLGIKLEASGRAVLRIPLLEDRELWLDLDQATVVNVRNLEIRFTHEGTTFVLYPDTNPPELCEGVQAKNGGDEFYWDRLPLAR